MTQAASQNCQKFDKQFKIQIQTQSMFPVENVRNPGKPNHNEFGRPSHWERKHQLRSDSLNYFARDFGGIAEPHPALGYF